MKKHDQSTPLSGHELGTLYPEVLSYDQRVQRADEAVKRREAARPTYLAARIAAAMTGVVFIWIVSIRLGVFFLTLNSMTGVSFSLLLFLLSISAVLVMYGYASKLLGYRDRGTGGFFASYASILFVASSIAAYFGWADLIKIALSPVWISLVVLVGHYVIVHLLTGLFVGYGRR